MIATCYTILVQERVAILSIHQVRLISYLVTVPLHASTHVFEDNFGFFAVANGHKCLQPAALPETLDVMR